MRHVRYIVPLSTLILVGAGLAAVRGLTGGAFESLDARDQRRLERAHEVHDREVERATEAYQQSVQRANATLARIYEPIIAQYQQQGEAETAEALRKSVIDRCAAALNISEGEAAAPATENAGGHTDLIRSIGPVLVDARGKEFSTDLLAGADYVALYFSAGWCPPCKAFTPKLVEFFHHHHNDGRVHVILVSSDRNEDGMFKYMQSAEMPWLAIPYGRVGASGVKQRFGVRSIPQLYVLDRDGNTVAASQLDGQYRGASYALSQFEQLMTGGRQ